MIILLHAFMGLVGDVVHCVVILCCVMYCVFNTELLVYLVIDIVLHITWSFGCTSKIACSTS